MTFHAICVFILAVLLNFRNLVDNKYFCSKKRIVIRFATIIRLNYSVNTKVV